MCFVVDIVDIVDIEKTLTPTIEPTIISGTAPIKSRRGKLFKLFYEIFKFGLANVCHFNIIYLCSIYYTKNYV